MRVLDCEQRSDEWYAARLGRLGSSDAAEIYGVRRDGVETAGKRDLRMRLALERITGQLAEPGYVNRDMQRGIDLEPAAVAAYEALTGVFVDRCGYILHDDLPAGYSPDGLVSDDGLIEVKCPKPAIHLEYLVNNKVPPAYLAQCKHAVWLTGRAWIDFVSYCPQMPDDLQLFVTRAYARDLDVAGHGDAVALFLESVDAMVTVIESLKRKAAA